MDAEDFETIGFAEPIVRDAVDALMARKAHLIGTVIIFGDLNGPHVGVIEGLDFDGEEETLSVTMKPYVLSTWFGLRKVAMPLERTQLALHLRFAPFVNPVQDAEQKDDGSVTLLWCMSADAPIGSAKAIFTGRTKL